MSFPDVCTHSPVLPRLFHAHPLVLAIYRMIRDELAGRLTVTGSQFSGKKK